MSTYVVSDLHGQLGAFIRGIEQIKFSESDELYVIGDAIDRGPDGIKILQYIKSHKNMDLLIGNHEDMMLKSVDPQGEAKCTGPDPGLWLGYNGGSTTLKAWYELTTVERLYLLLWLKTRKVIMTLDVNGKPFCLTHSYYDPELENMEYCDLSDSEVSDVTWKSMFRDDDLHAEDIYKEYNYTFITGHVPVQVVRHDQSGQRSYGKLEPLKHGNVYDIDGFCALGYHPQIPSGALFFRLDDVKCFPIPLVKEEWEVRTKSWTN